MAMICNKCHKEKDLKEFGKRSDSKKGYRGICRDCVNEKKREWWKQTAPARLEYSKKWYANNREEIIKQKVIGNLKYRRLAKLDCIEHYSDGKNCCECCGERHIEFLAIDHKEGNGKKHRLSIKEYLPIYLKRHGYPKGFRILCHNCNMSLGFFGYCPHKEVNNGNK